MEILAVIDATNSRAPDGPATTVAGLSLLERNLRLAAVCGAQEILVLTADSSLSAPGARSIDVPIRQISPAATFRPTISPDIAIFLDAETVFDRSYVQRTLLDFIDTTPHTAACTACGHLAIKRLESTDRLEPIHLKNLKGHSRSHRTLCGGWTLPIDSNRAVERAERRLWNSCRKAEDGIVARYFNRHISLAISRRLAPTSIRPDHITAVTFLLGLAAAIAAAFGTYFGFLIAGLLYQLNSIIDGVDGELARARYEFSLRGEWLDTISDDMADLLIYFAIGVGAWRTVAEFPGPFDATAWLVLGILAATAKLVTMLLYYRWLATRGRGDLLAFQWSFESDSESDATFRDRILRGLRYLFRKDFIVFIAMVSSFGGYLPHLLFVLAPGNVIVAATVLLENRRSRHTIP